MTDIGFFFRLYRERISQVEKKLEEVKSGMFSRVGWGIWNVLAFGTVNQWYNCLAAFNNIACRTAKKEQLCQNKALVNNNNNNKGVRGGQRYPPVN